MSGSYRLGAYTKDADIDVVFVTTCAVTRANVYSGFVAALLGAEGVTDVAPVPRARVPIISLRIDGQEFDVLTCHLRTRELPPRAALLQSYDWMSTVDEACVLGFSAIRVTELLIASVPQWPQYLLALRFLRLWAKRRCVYSNKAGYFGGVNLALLTCVVVRLFPRALACTVIIKFFELFSEWRWGTANPVRLHTDDATASVRCPVWLTSWEWTPKVNEARVVLTPCFPRTNSMFSACSSTCLVMHRELRRGVHILHAPAEGRVSGSVLAAVCAPLALLATCSRFLRVTISAPNTASGRSWQGYMESQTRHLVQYLSKQELAVKEFRYLPKWVSRPPPSSSPSPSPSPTSSPSSTSSSVPFTSPSDIVRETYICAEDDGKVRTYVIRGRIDVPFEYFMRMHAENGPLKPKAATAKLEFIGPEDVIKEAFDIDKQLLLQFAVQEPLVLLTLTPDRASDDGVDGDKDDAAAPSTACIVPKPESTAQQPMRYLGVPKPYKAVVATTKRLRIVTVPPETYSTFVWKGKK